MLERQRELACVESVYSSCRGTTRSTRDSGKSLSRWNRFLDLAHGKVCSKRETDARHAGTIPATTATETSSPPAANAHCQRKHGERGETQVLAQSAHRVADVL